MATEKRQSRNTDAAEDAQLLRSISAADRAAFATLFDSYYPRLFRFLFRFTHSHGAAEELANDVLLTVWKDAAKFRGDSKASTWIFGIAYRKALAHNRKAKSDWVTLEDEHAKVEHATERMEEVEWVRHGIESLPAKQKLTIMLVYFLGMSCRETAEATGVPESTVKTRMFHARRKLKTHLAESSTPKRWKKD